MYRYCSIFLVIKTIVLRKHFGTFWFNAERTLTVQSYFCTGQQCSFVKILKLSLKLSDDEKLELCHGLVKTFMSISREH